MHTKGHEHARLLYIEDDDSVREGVSTALEGLGYEVHAMADGTGLATALEEVQPDLALLDVGLPGPSGFELAALIRSTSDIPMFFLTAADATDDRVRGFDLGADDYLIKPFSTRELAVRIRAVLRRVAPASRQLLTVGDLQVNLAGREVLRGDQLINLTPTEFDLLAALAKDPTKAWSKRDLFKAVWGIDEHAPHIVEVHISAIRRKLEVHGPRIIVTGRDGKYSVRA